MKEVGVGRIAVLDRTGHTEISWDESDPASVDKAKAEFDALRKSGFLVYRKGVDGAPDEQAVAFDPKAGRYYATPPLVGG